MPGQMPFSIRALRRGQAVGANVANLDLAATGRAYSELVAVTVCP
jgi:hypothetical protein